MGSQAPAGDSYQLGKTFLLEDQSFSGKNGSKTIQSNLFLQEIRRSGHPQGEMGSNWEVWVSQLLPRSREGAGFVLAVPLSQTEVRTWLPVLGWDKALLSTPRVIL